MAKGSGFGCLYSQLVETRYGTFSLKMCLGVFGPAAARRAVERVDRLAVVGRDDAARLDDRLGRQRIFGQRAEVHLARVGRADVVALVPVLPEVPLDVGARRDGLRLQRLDLSERRRVELVRDDAAQVLLERQLVDDRQRAARVAEHFERAAIGARARSRAARRRLDAHARAGRQHEHDAAVELDGHAVLQVRLLERAGGRGIEREDGRKRRRAGGPLFDGEGAGRPDRHGRGILIQADADDGLGGRLGGSSEQQDCEKDPTHGPWSHGGSLRSLSGRGQGGSLRSPVGQGMIPTP